MLDADGAAGKAPAPVVADSGGGVHAGFGAEGEDVLQGEDAGVGYRFGGGTDERPDDGLIAACPGVDADGGALALVGAGGPPAGRGVVVMGAGVDDGVGLVAVRKVVVRAAVVEAELQDAHAGHVEGVAELIDFWGDEAEVFRDEGDGAEGFDEAREELCAGALDPVAVDGGLFVGGDGPVGVEAAEVIEADDVVHGVGAADAIDPPVEVAMAQHIPAKRGLPQRWPVWLK